jgi:hypothetical protein
VPDRFVNLVHSDVLSFRHINDGSEVSVENGGHSRLFRKGDVTNRAIVSPKRNVAEIKISLLWRRRRRRREWTNWGYDQACLQEAKLGRYGVAAIERRATQRRINT